MVGFIWTTFLSSEGCAFDCNMTIRTCGSVRAVSIELYRRPTGEHSERSPSTSLPYEAEAEDMGAYGRDFRDARSRDPRQSNCVYEQLSPTNAFHHSSSSPSRRHPALPAPLFPGRQHRARYLATLSFSTLSLRR